MSCRTATAPARCSSRFSPINGTSTPRRWRSRRSRPCASARPCSCRRNGKRRSSTGWTISSRGASRGKSGGAIKFRRGTGRTERSSSPRARTMRWPTRWRTTPRSRRSPPRRATTSPPIRIGARALPPSICIATTTCSTPGSPRRCGRSRPWAGRTRRRSSSASIRPRRWSPASTSSSSGSRA